MEDNEKQKSLLAMKGAYQKPDVSSLPEPDVMIQTRKGVAVSYSQAQMAG